MASPLSAVAIAGATVYLSIVGGASVAVGWRASRWIDDDDPLARALVWLLASVAFVMTLGVGLAAVGLLAPASVVLVSVGTLTVLAWRHRSRSGGQIPASREDGTDQNGGTWGDGAPMVIGLLTAGLALATVLGATAGHTEHFESRHYHYVAVRQFAEGGTLWGLPFQNPGFFTATHPSGSEVIGAVVSFATGGDHLLYLWQFPLAAAVTIAGATLLCRSLDADPALGAVAAVAVLVSPFGWEDANSLAGDLLASAGILAAVALVLRARSIRSTRLLTVAGAALGIALATKYTAFGPTAAVVVATAAASRPWSRVLHLVPGGLLLGGPWLVRNAVETGNPLFPMAIGGDGSGALLPGGSGPLDRLSGTVGGLLLRTEGASLDVWAELTRALWGPLALVALGGLAFTAVRSVAHRSAALVLVAAVGLASLVSYAATPYTAAGDPPLRFLMGSNLRYALPAVLLLSVGLAGAAPRWLAVGALALSTLWGIENILDDSPLRPDLAVTATDVAVAALGGAIAALVAVAFAERPHRRRVATGVLAVASIGALVGTARTPAPPTQLETLVARAQPQGDILAIGVSDLRSVIGPDFDRRAVVAGEDPVDPRFEQAAQLSRAVDASPADVLVLGPRHEGVPDGFSPSASWIEVGMAPNVVVYVRRGSPAQERITDS